MMCCCEKCKFVFESVKLLDRCPDCGHGPVREATDKEISEYAANRLEYGPMMVYGVKNIMPVQEVEIPMLVSVKKGCPVFQMRTMMAPAICM